jgi:hypothetical protein
VQLCHPFDLFFLDQIQVSWIFCIFCIDIVHVESELLRNQVYELLKSRSVQFMHFNPKPTKLIVNSKGTRRVVPVLQMLSYTILEDFRSSYSILYGCVLQHILTFTNRSTEVFHKCQKWIRLIYRARGKLGAGRQSLST